MQSGPDMVIMGKLPLTPKAKKVIEYSIEEARNLNHNYVGTEHLLLGLLREGEGAAGPGSHESWAEAANYSESSAEPTRPRDEDREEKTNRSFAFRVR